MGEEEEGNFAAIWEKAARISGAPYLPLPKHRSSRNSGSARTHPGSVGNGPSHFTSAGPGAGLGYGEDTEGLGSCPGGRGTSVRSAESRTEPRKSAQRRVRKSLGGRQSARHRARPGEPQSRARHSLGAARPERGGSWESVVGMRGQGNAKGKSGGGQEESCCKRPTRAGPLQVGNNCQVLPEGSQLRPPSLNSPRKSRRRTPRCGEWTLLAPGSRGTRPFIALLSTRIFPIPEVLRSRKCVQRGES